ncbi:MAG: response regulator transcription factor [Hyphomicrobium sp.]|nr:response regulator transcription factor [Hyphomicrobium sp.]
MKSVITIIDDDSAIIDSMGLLLAARDYEIDSYTCATDFLTGNRPSSCIVCDVRMPGMSGLELLLVLKKKSDSRPFILLTGHGDIEMAVNAIKQGAFDFIEKPFDPIRLLSTVSNALSASAKLQAEDSEKRVFLERYQSLTDRQRETMCLLIKGLANKEIAARLSISPRTVEIHRTWVMNKMAAGTLAELVRMGIALKLVE